MQYKFFSIPAFDGEQETQALNQFLHHQRILTVTREFISDANNPYWFLAIEYMSGSTPSGSEQKSTKKRIDYKEQLSPEDFVLYVKLREWRKLRAEQEGVPVYTIFTNEQLAKIATEHIISREALAHLDGVGEGRVNKYAEAVIDMVKNEQ